MKFPHWQRLILGLLWLLPGFAGVGRADDPNGSDLDQTFDAVVHPFVTKYCLGCHNPKKQEGKLDLSGYATSAAVAAGYRTWELTVERVEAVEMPPEAAADQPTEAERHRFLQWSKAIREREAKRNAGDPGPVLARRLSNSEFDNTIRDLVGVDLRPAREFPVDPANEAGFDNSGESLTISPALVKKYLAAGREMADHLVFTPNGFLFAPDAAVAETDRDKYCVQRIITFYERHQVDYAAYFLAAWTYKYREALGQPKISLEDIASQAGLSPTYLATLWTALNKPAVPGPLRELQALWEGLPADIKATNEVSSGCQKMRALVIQQREQFKPSVERLEVKGISSGSQPFVLWRNRQVAGQRMGPAGAFGNPGQREFCRVFPDTFFLKARDGVRLLSAGFHLMQGYFRDDAPLYELVLDEAGRTELDRLWEELNFATSAPIRQYKDFIFFERAEPPQFLGGAEFDFARSEDQSATSEAGIKKLSEVYLAKARKNEASDLALKAIESYFETISAEIRKVEQGRVDAEPKHLEALLGFATRAYRRPLSEPERDGLLTFYRQVRDQNGLGHEEAIRDVVAWILISPQFLYRAEPAEPGEATTPLSDFGLASRLSYFLWSSMPDDELMSHAVAGDLHQPVVLVAQARRMLHDPRVRGLACEFAGNWLDFRRFEEHAGVDRERFPAFTNELRQAMFEEPVRFFMDVVTQNRSVLDFLVATDTFVNPVLAKHYGIPVPDGGPSHWIHVEDAANYGRGGLLPMSAFLTKNSPGLRTSPVKRGYWVVRRVLGEEIPPPPADVPELPKDEADSGDLTLPQLLARHRDNKSCLGCHQRFDTVGLSFEGYGPTGERRERDLGGRPIDSHATMPGGYDADGVQGLRQYLMERRASEFVDNLCRKLLSYALGRTLRLSDDGTVQAMRTRLEGNQHRFEGLVETIITSPQFLNKRGQDNIRD